MSETKPSGVPDGAAYWRWTDEDRLRGGPSWGPGPWDNEPDKVSWTDPATGRPCLIVRGPIGALCGYVAVDPGHPLHGAGYDEVPDEVHDAAHGGLTFADACAHSEDEAHGICHVPQPGQPEDVWWFGFDCAHHMDLVPGTDATRAHYGLGPMHSSFPETYRTIRYVAGRCRSLASALAEAG